MLTDLNCEEKGDLIQEVDIVAGKFEGLYLGEFVRGEGGHNLSQLRERLVQALRSIPLSDIRCKCSVYALSLFHISHFTHNYLTNFKESSNLVGFQDPPPTNEHSGLDRVGSAPLSPPAYIYLSQSRERAEHPPLLGCCSSFANPLHLGVGSSNFSNTEGPN